MNSQIKRYSAADVPEARRPGLWVHAGDLNQALELAANREAALQLRLNTADQRVDELTTERDALKAEVGQLKRWQEEEVRNGSELLRRRDALQSELTKARELLEGVRGIVSKQEATMFGSAPEVMKELRVFLAHQSAPAAKGECCDQFPKCVHGEGADGL